VREFEYFVLSNDYANCFLGSYHHTSLLQPCGTLHSDGPTSGSPIS